MTLMLQLLKFIADSSNEEADCIQISEFASKESRRIISEYINILRVQANRCESYLCDNSSSETTMQVVATMICLFYDQRSRLTLFTPANTSEQRNKRSGFSEQKVEVFSNTYQDSLDGINRNDGNISDSGITEICNLYRNQSMDVKESVAAVLMAENALKSSGSQSWLSQRFSRGRINVGFMKFLSGLYHNRATLYRKLERMTVRDSEFLFGEKLSEILSKQGDDLLSLSESLSKNMNRKAPISFKTPQKKGKQPSSYHFEDDQVLKAFDINPSPTESLSKIAQGSYPRLPPVDSTRASLVNFLMCLLRREANDLQIMSAFEFNDDKILHEGMIRQFEMLTEEHDALAELEKETDDIESFVSGLEYMMSSRRREMRAHADFLQNGSNEKIQWYQGIVMKMDAVIFDKLVLDLRVILDRDEIPEPLDVVDIFCSVYTERKRILHELSDYLLKERQFKLSKFIKRQAELQEDIVHEMTILFGSVSEPSKPPTSTPDISPDTLTTKAASNLNAHEYENYEGFQDQVFSDSRSMGSFSSAFERYQTKSFEQSINHDLFRHNSNYASGYIDDIDNYENDTSLHARDGLNTLKTQ